MAYHKLLRLKKRGTHLPNNQHRCYLREPTLKHIAKQNQFLSLEILLLTKYLEITREMRAIAPLATFNQKIIRSCKKLLVRITKSCPRHRHYQHMKLRKASSSSSSSSGKQVTRVLASFFVSFQKKKQRKERMKRLNKRRSFSDSVGERKASNPESRKKVLPSSLTPSCLGQDKAHSQDKDARRDSTSAFLP